MKSDLKNHSCIDGANLYKGVNELGWRLDYFRFRKWLAEKYHVANAYIFLGFVADNKGLYDYLRRAGFILVFRTITFESDGKPKGNCDSQLVMQVMSDFYELRFNQAILVSGDGDFDCLALFLLNRQALKSVIAPNSKSCSYLIKRIQGPLLFLNDYKRQLRR